MRTCVLNYGSITYCMYVCVLTVDTRAFFREILAIAVKRGNVLGVRKTKYKWDVFEPSECDTNEIQLFGMDQLPCWLATLFTRLEASASVSTCHS
jgi:hypothetical protein